MEAVSVLASSDLTSIVFLSAFDVSSPFFDVSSPFFDFLSFFDVSSSLLSLLLPSLESLLLLLLPLFELKILF